MQIKVLNSNSDGNCIVLKDDNGEMLLLDAGIPIKKIKEGIDFNISDLAGAICSHVHGDHAKAIPDLKKIGIKVFTPYKNADGTQKTYLGNYEVIAIPMLKSDGTFAHTNSDGTECKCYGFYITHKEIKDFNLVYITDTMYSKYKFENLKNLIIGTNYQMDKLEDKNGNRKFHVITGHLSLESCLELLKVDMPTDNVILSHLSLENADADLFKEKAQEVVKCPVYIAKAGLKINL